MKNLTAIQKELLIGSLMGDAGIAKRGNSYRARFAHSDKQRSYLEWKKELLNSIVSMDVLDLTTKKEDKIYDACSFTTLSGSELKEFYDLFYFNGIKTITKELLDHLTPFALAVWYMDDGCLIKDIDNRYNKHIIRHRIYFALGKVSLQEAELVKEYFKGLEIDSYVIKGYNKEYDRCYPNIKLSYPGTRKFLELIKGLVPDCMSYKISHVPVTTTRQAS
jgi:recombination protein RecA